MLPDRALFLLKMRVDRSRSSCRHEIDCLDQVVIFLLKAATQIVVDLMIDC